MKKGNKRFRRVWLKYTRKKQELGYEKMTMVGTGFVKTRKREYQLVRRGEKKLVPPCKDIDCDKAVDWWEGGCKQVNG